MSETGNQVAAASGLMLAAARRAQGLDIAGVARQLKLSVSQISALETGNFDKLPGPVFVRGFIRNYARLLKLDPDAVWSSIEPDMPRHSGYGEVPPSRDIPMPSEQVRRSWLRYVMAALLLFAGLVVYEFYLSDTETGEQRPVQPVAAPALAPPGTPVAQTQTAALGTPSVRTEPGAAVAASAAAIPQAEDRADTAGAAASVAVPPAEKAASGNQAQSSRQGEHELRLVFEKQSWVEIRDRSGRAIMSRINQPGTEQRVSGMPPFSLIIGNAHSVRLTYNDNPVDLAQHTAVDVARLTLK
ncbi:MAG: RodZ domain-containing protein [Pseudomonadota bacterium]